MRLVWEEFLSHCGIALPALGPQAMLGGCSEPCSEATSPVAPPALGGPCAQRAAEALAQRRGVCPQRAVRELGDRSEAAKRHYSAALQRWDQSATLPPSAVELLQVLDIPHDLEVARGRVKSWQAHCKDEAWLMWYAAKREWLRTDLDVAREHSSALRGEIAALREAGRRLEETSKNICAQLRQQQHKVELRRSARKLRELGSDELRSTQDDRQLMWRKAPEAMAALDAERRTASELASRLEEARRAAHGDMEVREVQHRYLRQRAQVVLLEKQRYARTCAISKVSGAALELMFRGGMRARVVQASDRDSGHLVHLTLALPESGPATSFRPDEDLPDLARDLLARSWREILAALSSRAPAPGERGQLDAVLPRAQLPKLLRYLDFAALRTSDQLAALRSLRRECPEVMWVAPRLRGDVLAVAITLLVVRSHTVAAGPGGITPISGDVDSPVEAAECVLEFSAELANFPDHLDWSGVSVRQTFGRGEAEAMVSTLRGLSSAGLGEAIAAAIQAARRAGAPWQPDATGVRRASGQGQRS